MLVAGLDITAAKNRKDKLRKNDITLTTLIDNGIINVKKSQIIQVLVNLINNSADAIERNEEKWIDISYEVNENKHRIKITDSGLGIPKEVQKKMFEAFYTTKGVEKGTGLGLSVCKRIMESHGGKFYIDNQCKNTRFVLEFIYP